jgi:hypothetical protein
MKKLILLLLFIPSVSFTQTPSQQDDLPFSEIGDYPNEFSQSNIVSRMIEGLGYRYYWATKSLTENDLKYKPSDDSRTTIEVIKHIHELTIMISSSFEKKIVDFPLEQYDYKLLREKTLLNLKYIHDELKSSPDFSKLSISFKRGDSTMFFPFWNQINGPISDALWHCGQVVMNRRASGNPLQKGVNVFVGKTSN